MAEGRACQDMERNRPSKAHSLSGGGRGRDLSGQGKKPTERGTLTLWRWQKVGLVRIWKEIERARRTHFLEVAVGGTCQDTKRNRPSEAHSLPVGGSGSDMSGHGNKTTDRGALTSWSWQWERPVRTWKQTERARCTHFLEVAVGGTCQDTKIDRLSDAHSLPGGGSERDLSGHRMQPSERGALTSWRWK